MMDGDTGQKVGIDERYKQAFESHRHASDYRLKLLAGWGVVYGAFTVAFFWTQGNAKAISWIVPALGMVFTVFAWIADNRNRAAIRQSKKVGDALEAEMKLPDDQRFFYGLKDGITHSTAINVSAIVVLVLLGYATCYLLCHRGVLPQ